ncbi:MAG TPA: flavodoxin family protein [Dehalococcoidia bacterium]|nr:flavodoxin family protein [Dehalococcoidia bacterium]
MKILFLSGSRDRNGRTAGSIQTIITGAEKAGAKTESFFLPELNLQHCRQCDANGWGSCRKEGHCVVEDDFQMLVNKIQESDVVVFATPVYFRDLSESMKAFLDKLRRISAFNPDPKTKGISAVGLCMAGGGGGGAISACMYLESTLQMCRFDVIDMIPIRRQNFEIKLPMLELTGEWLVTKPTSAAE